MWVRIPRGREPRVGTSRRLLGVLPVLALAFSSGRAAPPRRRPQVPQPHRRRRRRSVHGVVVRLGRPHQAHPVPDQPWRPGRYRKVRPPGGRGNLWRYRFELLAVSVGRFDTDQAPAEQSGPVPEGLPGLRRRPINGGLRGRTRRRAGRGLSQLPADPRAVHRRHQGSVVNPGFSPEGRSRVADPGWRPPASANRRSSSAHRSVPPRTRC